MSMQGIQSTEPRTATAIAARASELVGGDRDRQHGSKRENFENIAALWNAYLDIRALNSGSLDGTDVGHMMALMKIARTQSGSLNIDDYVDGAGYLACAGEVAIDYENADAECQAAVEGLDGGAWSPDAERPVGYGAWRLVPEFEIGDQIRSVYDATPATVIDVDANGYLRVQWAASDKPGSAYHAPDGFERVH